MRGLLERNIASIAERLVVLSPPQASVPRLFRNITGDGRTRADFLKDLQRLRGQVYLHDGAVTPADLTLDGRHETPEDDRSWHLLMVDRRQRPTACLWYLEHEDASSIEDLRIRTSPPALNGTGQALRASVDMEMRRARAERVAYSEVGGWASERYDQCCPEGLLLILATFGLSRMMGGALGVTTATVRHSSAAILRRLGLSYFPLGDASVPPYYDPKYGCDMELLRFDTRRSHPKYERLVAQLMNQLPDVRVLTSWPETSLAASAAAGRGLPDLGYRPGTLVAGAAA
jgi:hypothetical protein